MNHDSGFIIGIAHFFFAKTLIQRTPKNHFEKASKTLALCKVYRSPSKYQVKRESVCVYHTKLKFAILFIMNHGSGSYQGLPWNFAKTLIERSPKTTLESRFLFETTFTVFFIIMGQPNSQDEEKEWYQNTEEFQNMPVCPYVFFPFFFIIFLLHRSTGNSEWHFEIKSNYACLKCYCACPWPINEWKLPVHHFHSEQEIVLSRHFAHAGMPTLEKQLHWTISILTVLLCNILLPLCYKRTVINHHNWFQMYSLAQVDNLGHFFPCCTTISTCARIYYWQLDYTCMCNYKRLR